MLHGPPGTGKTAIVRALAAECAAAGWGSSGSSSSKPVALFARKGTDCLGKYAGDAELHLRLLFDMVGAGHQAAADTRIHRATACVVLSCAATVQQQECSSNATAADGE